jgi:N-terminal 7TM region of histidine kinase
VTYNGAGASYAPLNILDLETALLAITAAINAGLVFFVLRGRSRNVINRTFGIFVSGLSVWALLHIEFRIVESDQIAIFFLKLSYVCALVIGASFFHFSIVYPQESQLAPAWTRVIALLTIPFSLALLIPGFLTGQLWHASYGRAVQLYPAEYLAFAALFLFLFIGGQVRLWFKFLRAAGPLRTQLFAIASSVTGIGLIGVYFDLLLPSPFFENFRYVWTGPVLTSVFALTVTYAIFRYRLFDLKAAVTELLVFGWWLGILVRALVPNAVVGSVTEQVLIVLSAPIGTLLLRSLKEKPPGLRDRER